MAEWFDRVYSDPLYLALYEAEDEARATSEAEAAAHLCGAAPGDRWLDACCGFGGHVEILSGLGFRTTGIDRSEMLLARACTRARSRGLQMQYVRGDIRALPFVHQFEVASLFFDSFGFFARDVDHLDALLSLSLALCTNGRLLIDLCNRERLLAGWQEESQEAHDAAITRNQYWLDLARGRYGWRQRIRGSGTDRTWEFDLRLFSASELASLLAQAGFGGIRLYGDWTGAPYGLASPRMIVAARKLALEDLPPPAD